MSTICVTGHRPNKLWGYDLNAPKYQLLKEKMKNFLVAHNCTHAITGMALGIDQLFALAVLELKDEGHDITLEAAIPCQNHAKQWPKSSQELWQDIVSKCDITTLVTDEPYKPYLMQIRNEYMVDNADEVLAIWDGTRGGTGNCVDYASRQLKPTFRINPSDI